MKKSFIFALTNVLEFLNIHVTCEDEKLLYTNADDMMAPPKKTAKSKKAKGTLDNKAANAKTVTKDRILATNQSSNTRISGTINIQTRTNNSFAPKTAAPKTVAPKTATKGDGKENAVQKANVEATTTSKQPPKTAPKPITGMKKFFQNKPIHMDLTPTASEAERAKEFRDAAYALYKNDPERGNKIFNPHVYEARLRALNKSKVATVPTTIPEAAEQTASTEIMETDETEHRIVISPIAAPERFSDKTTQNPASNGLQNSGQKATDPTPITTKFAWKDRHMRTLPALDQLQRVDLSFFFESQKFDKNRSTTKAEVDVSGVPFQQISSMQNKGFINQKEFYADLKRKAFYIMEQSKDYMDLVEKGCFMTHVFKYFYRCYDPLNNVVTWSKAVEPFDLDQNRTHNPRAPFLDDLGITTVKIHILTTIMEPKMAKGKMADSIRPQKGGRTPPRTRSPSRTRAPSRTRTPPRTRTPSRSRPTPRDRSRSHGRQRDLPDSRSQQERDREQRTQRSTSKSIEAEIKPARTAPKTPTNRLLTTVERVLTGTPYGTTLKDLTHKGRQEVRKLHTRFQTEALAEAKMIKEKEESLQQDLGLSKLNLNSPKEPTIQEFFSQHVCPNGPSCGTCPQPIEDEGEESGSSPDEEMTPTPIRIITFRPLLVGSLEADEQPPTEIITPKQHDKTDHKPKRHPEVSRPYSEGEVDEEGYNQKERDYKTTQKACDNAIKRLKAIAAYSGLWLPSEKAAKLNELYLQFKLESQNMSIDGLIIKTRPSRLKSKRTSTPSRRRSTSRHRSSSKRRPSSGRPSSPRRSSTSRRSGTSSTSTSRQRPRSTSRRRSSSSRPRDDLREVITVIRANHRRR